MRPAVANATPTRGQNRLNRMDPRNACDELPEPFESGKYGVSLAIAKLLEVKKGGCERVE